MLPQRLTSAQDEERSQLPATRQLRPACAPFPHTPRVPSSQGHQVGFTSLYATNRLDCLRSGLGDIRTRRPGVVARRPHSVFKVANAMDEIRRRKREAIQRARKSSLENGSDEEEAKVTHANVSRAVTSTPAPARTSSTPRSLRSVASNKSLGDADPLGNLFSSGHMEASLSVRIEPHVKRLRTQARDLVNGQEQSVKVREERLNQAVEELEKAR